MGIGEDYNIKLKVGGDEEISFAMQQAIDRAKLFLGDYKKTSEQDAIIDRFVSGVTEKWGGNPPGDGDKFNSWCKKHGRQLPSNVIIIMMNNDPAGARIAIRNDSDNPKVFRNLVTYISMGGLKNV